MIKAANKRGNEQKTQSNTALEINDPVFLETPYLSSAINKEIDKFFHIYREPFKVNKIINNNVIQLTDPKNKDKIKGTFN